MFQNFVNFLKGCSANKIVEILKRRIRHQIFEHVYKFQSAGISESGIASYYKFLYREYENSQEGVPLRKFESNLKLQK